MGLDPQAGKLSPFKLKEGRFATGPGQVVIDAGTADREGYSVGDTITVQTRGPERKVEVTGIATFGDVDSIGTATFALFDLDAAQSLFDKRGSYTEILVGGPDSVRAQLSDSLPGSVQVQTAAAHDRFTLDGAEDVREVPEGAPARVRRHRRRRGRVHHLQHALDHGRAALA